MRRRIATRRSRTCRRRRRSLAWQRCWHRRGGHPPQIPPPRFRANGEAVNSSAQSDLELLRRHRYRGSTQNWRDRRTDLYKVWWREDGRDRSWTAAEAAAAASAPPQRRWVMFSRGTLVCYSDEVGAVSKQAYEMAGAPLSDDEIAGFMEEGYVALPGIIPDEHRLRLNADVDRLEALIGQALHDMQP